MPDHCIEEDILKQGMGIREYVCKILTCLMVCNSKFMDSLLNCS